MKVEDKYAIKEQKQLLIKHDSYYEKRMLNYK